MLNRKGQNIAEYSILIAIVIAAAVAMQVYVKRGIQGRIADATDTVITAKNIAGEDLVFTNTQYEPYYVESNAEVTSSRDFNEEIGARADIARKDIVESTTRAKDSYEKTLNYDDEVR